MFMYGYEKLSVCGIVSTFLAYLPKAKESQLKKINNKLCDVKEIFIAIPTKEEVLFSRLTERLS